MKNSKMIIIDQENGSLYTEKIKMLQGDQIETENGIYKKEEDNYTRYYDENNDSLVYIMNLDIPAKTEAENLKTLRRSVAINNAFNYEKKKGIDPVIIIMAIIMFSMVVF